MMLLAAVIILIVTIRSTNILHLSTARYRCTISRIAILEDAKSVSRHSRTHRQQLLISLSPHQL
ncbi:unnamed protein product [Cylicostephanus goldi]|uniref:Uncharacterized protein n=1 Tax=Cylicostephanus goldi TaxID=71465 RepID=A0A3P6TAU3_CYLGO|nr:unnamed protein product [Cylicostephanus goldi]